MLLYATSLPGYQRRIKKAEKCVFHIHKWAGKFLNSDDYNDH